MRLAHQFFVTGSDSHGILFGPFGSGHGIFADAVRVFWYGASMGTNSLSVGVFCVERLPPDFLQVGQFPEAYLPSDFGSDVGRVVTRIHCSGGTLNTGFTDLVVPDIPIDRREFEGKWVGVRVSGGGDDVGGFVGVVPGFP